MIRREEAGFTLLEIVVALAVFGFLLVGLSQTVRFGLTAWHQSARLSDRKTDLEAVDRTLRSIVEDLYPGDEAGRSPVDGTSDRLTGITRLRIPGSVHPVPIEAGVALSRGRLVLRWRPYHHTIPLGSPIPPVETPLMTGVSRLAVEYWRSPGAWVSSWHEPDLPLLIRFRIILAGPGATPWPDIVVAPMLSRP